MRSDISVHVTHYHRNPFGGHSVERLFAVIRAAFPENVECTVAVCRFRSSGVFRRLWNLTEAPLYQSQVNHITGDVHYLATLLHKLRTIFRSQFAASGAPGFSVGCGTLRKHHFTRVRSITSRAMFTIWRPCFTSAEPF